MIQKYVDAWIENKDKYEEWLRGLDYNWYVVDYEIMVKQLINLVINPCINDGYEGALQADSVTVIDNGDYQGTQIFIIPYDVYQPNEEEYVYTHVGYGSCSGCDTLLNALSLSDYDEKLSDGTVDMLMVLALHLIENFKPLAPETEY